MHILFIDESGTIPPQNKSNKHLGFVLGGIIIPEDVWYPLSDDLETLRAAFKVEGEIKWRYFAPAKPGSCPHTLSHLNATEKELLRSEIYKLVHKHQGIKIISAVVDIQQAYAFSHICNENDLYCNAYEQIAKNFQLHLQESSDHSGKRTHGIIVCDHRHPQNDQYLRCLHQQLFANQKRNYQNLIENVFVEPSHFSVGIQLADMIAGAIYRKSFSGDKRCFELLDGIFRTNALGESVGHGLISYPEITQTEDAPC